MTQEELQKKLEDKLKNCKIVVKTVQAFDVYFFSVDVSVFFGGETFRYTHVLSGDGPFAVDDVVDKIIYSLGWDVFGR